MPDHVRTSASLDDILGKGLQILIRTKPEIIKHKTKGEMMKKYPKGDGVCFWTLNRIPKKPVDEILFTDGKQVFGKAEIVEVIETYPKGTGNVVFKPIKLIKAYPQPKKAPTRGFTYVEGTSN